MKENVSAAEMKKLDLGDTAKNMFDEILDGNVDKANDMFADIISKVASSTRDSVLTDIDSRISTATAKAAVERSVEDVIADLTANYPQLDNNSETFDEGLTKRVLNMQQVYMNEGYDRATALEKGTDDAIKMLRPDLITTETKETVKPSKRKEVLEKQRSEAVSKKVRAAQQQPSKTTGERGADNVVTVKDMSDEEFAALAQRDLAKLRGDIL